MKRNRKGRFVKQHKPSRWERLILGSILAGIFIGNLISPVYLEGSEPVYYNQDFDAPKKEVLQPVHLGSKESNFVINYDWSEEKIIEEIKETFSETPELAVAIADCESHLKIEMEGPTDDHGIFQIHAPTWDTKARQLGYEDYRDNPHHNLAMARYIYEDAGKTWVPWVCYTKKLY